MLPLYVVGRKLRPAVPEYDTVYLAWLDGLFVKLRRTSVFLSCNTSLGNPLDCRHNRNGLKEVI